MLRLAKGVKPCPECGSEEIYWKSNFYVSLICNECGYEMLPDNEFDDEELFIEKWNNL